LQSDFSGIYTRIYFDERKFIINLCDNFNELSDKEMIEMDGSKEQKIIVWVSVIAATLIKTPIIRKKNNRLKRWINRNSYLEDFEIQINRRIVEAVIYEVLSSLPKYINMKKLNWFYENNVLLAQDFKQSGELIKSVYEELTKVL